MNNFKNTFSIITIISFLNVGVIYADDHKKENLSGTDSTDTATEVKAEPKAEVKKEKPVDPSAVVIDQTPKAEKKEEPKKPSIPKNAQVFTKDADGNAKLKESSPDEKGNSGTPLGEKTYSQASRGKSIDSERAMKETKYDDNCRGAKFTSGQDKQGPFIKQAGTGKKIRGKFDPGSSADPAQLFQATASGQQRGMDEITPGQSKKTRVFRLDQPATLRDIGATEKNYTYYASTAPNIGMGKGILDAQLTAWGIDENGCLIWGGGGGPGQDGTSTK